MDVEQRVKEIITENWGIRPEEIKNDSAFEDDFGVDSLDVIELSMEIEDDFGIEIPDEDLEQIQTVQQLVDYLREKAA